MPKTNLTSESRDSRELKQRLQQAIRQQRAGNLVAAQRKCRSILKKMPKHREALQLLAILMQQSGNSKSALHYMQEALKTDSENPHLLKNLAEIHRSRGDLESAQHYAQLALAQAPIHVDALFTSAAVYLKQGHRQNAIEQFARVVALNPDDAEAHNELGNLMCVEGQLDSAINHYRHALAHQPGFIDCRINLANTLFEINDAEAAIEAYQRVLKVQPDNTVIHNSLGQAYEKQGNYDRAMSCYKVAHEQNPLLLQARLNMGKITLETDPKQAENWFKSVLDIDPKHTEGYYWLGILFQTLGKFERASYYLKQASRLDPEFAYAWYRLSLDQNFHPSDAQLKMLEQQFNSKTENGETSDQLISLDFSLGRFHDQRGDYASAFKYYQHGNRLRAGKNRFDRILHNAQIDRVIETFNTEFFCQRSDWGNASRLPLFVIGMPRSGTTLVEQILSAHPLVHGAGELRQMLDLTSTLNSEQGTATSHVETVASLHQQQVNKIAQDQLLQMHQLQPLARHVVDKLPGNYFRLGLIKLLFPAAAIIHCKRDPIDTCWSCYQQNFEEGLNFTNDLENMGHAYRGYQRLMAHWHQALPGQILDVNYEDLVQNTEIVTRKMLQHCEIEWHPQVLDYRSQLHPVNTASMWQVRQPMYQSSIGRWKNYHDYLQMLIQLLSNAGE
ncbi:MAG: tetratricopeptide repeat protein [Gammaproteobacteria bacterium]|nr:tetratricopeptide repeat protein [Gammaproteobacteria bacterium]